jgi:transposase
MTLGGHEEKREREEKMCAHRAKTAGRMPHVGPPCRCSSRATLTTHCVRCFLLVPPTARAAQRLLAMVNRKITEGVKLTAVLMYESGKMDLDDEILPLTDISRSTFFCCLSRYRMTGRVVNEPSTKQGRPRILVHEDIVWLLKIVENNPDTFLNEFDHLLRTNRFVALHYSTICRTLLSLGISRKRMSKIAIERNDILRGDFVRTMANFSPEQIACMDETSKDKRTWARRHGHARRGRCIRQKAPFVRGMCLSGTGLLTIDGMVACTVCEGSMTAEKLKKWLEDDVVSCKHAYIMLRTHAASDSHYLSIPGTSECHCTR